MATARAAPRADRSIRRDLAELAERQGFVHHVADAASGTASHDGARPAAVAGRPAVAARSPTPASRGPTARTWRISNRDSHQVTFRSIALAREFVLDPGTF